MAGLNCWEFKGCERQPGGAKVRELGVCPAATETRTNGMNEGLNAGRVCWAVTGTFCGGKAQGTFATKIGSCMDCEFFGLVVNEQGRALQNGPEVLHALQGTVPESSRRK